MGEQLATPDLRIASIAGRQHGVVSYGQLRGVGVGKNTIWRRASRGQLHRVHRGVYAVGHRALSIEGRWTAAVLAVGGGVANGTVFEAWGAAVSHRSAAELWELLSPREGPVDVTAAGAAGRSPRSSLRVHRSRTLTSGDVTLRSGIPVTTIRRTLEDLKRSVPPRLVRRAIRQAELFHGYDATGLVDRTRSDLELYFLAFCRRYRLPAPEVNAKLAADLTVDFLWRGSGLVVETDDHRYHRGSVAFEDDHVRDFRLRRLGHVVRRYTGAQLRGHSAEIAAELGEILR